MAKNVRNLLAARLHQTALNNAELDYVYEDIVDNRLDIWLNEIPAADVEEVVRCKDCKYQDKGENDCEAWNLCVYRPWLHLPTEDDNYCVHGERKDG